MARTGQTNALAGVFLAALLCVAGCAKTEYVGNGTKGFWSDTPAQIPPNIAFGKAQPHLEATFEARCKELHASDDWCDKPPVDHMVRKGSYYFVTRTSYPYEDYDALTLYAVRVHVETGEVIPYK
jgi:hypothetical protein